MSYIEHDLFDAIAEKMEAEKNKYSGPGYEGVYMLKHYVMVEDNDLGPAIEIGTLYTDNSVSGMIKPEPSTYVWRNGKLVKL